MHRNARIAGIRTHRHSDDVLGKAGACDPARIVADDVVIVVLYPAVPSDGIEPIAPCVSRL